MELSSAIQESLLCLLCFDKSKKGYNAVRALVPPQAFDKFFREIATEANKYIDQYKKPPGEHTQDLIEVICKRDPDSKETYKRLYGSMLVTKEGINRDYVLANAHKFRRYQRCKSILSQGLEALNTEKDSSIDETEAILSSVGKPIAGMDMNEGSLRLNDPKQALSFLNKDTVDTFPLGIKEFDLLSACPFRGGSFLYMAPGNTGKSVSLETKIWTHEAGYVPMREIKEGYRPLLLGLRISNNTPEKTHILQAMPSGQKPVFDIYLRSGRIVRGIANSHPIRTWQGYVRADALVVGQITIGPRTLPLASRIMNIQEGYAIGAFLGDGCLLAREPRLCLHKDELCISEAVFPELRGKLQNNSKNGVEVPYSRKLWSWIDGVGLERVPAPKKRVPRVVFQWGKYAALACLAGLLDTDGHCSKNGVEISTASFALSEDLLTLFQVAGIYASRRKKTIILNQKEFVHWRVFFSDEVSKDRLRRRVLCYSVNDRKWARIKRARLVSSAKRNWAERLPGQAAQGIASATAGRRRGDPFCRAELWRHIGRKNPRKASQAISEMVRSGTRTHPTFINQAARWLGDTYLASMANGDLVFDEIVEIVRRPPEECWDMQTDKEHQSFVAEGVFTHNTWFCVHTGKRGLLNRAKVLHWTLEMNKEKVAQRYLQSFFSVTRREGQKIVAHHFDKDNSGRFTGLDKITIKGRPSFADEDIGRHLRKKIQSVLSHRPDLIIRQSPSGTLTIDQIRYTLDYLENAERFIPDILIIDYPELMKLKGDDIRVEIGRTHVALRGIFQERNIAGVMVSQSNTEGFEAKRLKVKHMAEDRSKYNTADIVMTYSQTGAEFERGLARLESLKVRDEEKSTVVLITQAYAIGQFVMDSTLMSANAYWSEIGQDEE